MVLLYMLIYYAAALAGHRRCYNNNTGNNNNNNNNNKLMDPECGVEGCMACDCVINQYCFIYFVVLCVQR